MTGDTPTTTSQIVVTATGQTRKLAAVSPPTEQTESLGVLLGSGEPVTDMAAVDTDRPVVEL